MVYLFTADLIFNHLTHCYMLDSERNALLPIVFKTAGYDYFGLP